MVKILQSYGEFEGGNFFLRHTVVGCFATFIHLQIT